MPTFTRHSLFRKYAAYFAGVVSALLIISGAVGGYFAYRESVTALEEVQQAKAQFAAAQIENFMVGVQAALHATVAKFNSDEPVAVDELQLELVALLRHHPEISDLHWIDAGGEERLALSRFDRNVVDASHDWSADPGFARRAAHLATSDRSIFARRRSRTSRSPRHAARTAACSRPRSISSTSGTWSPRCSSRARASRMSSIAPES